MNVKTRVILTLGFLGLGLAAHAAMERSASIERPLLKKSLADLPMVIGDWQGRDEPISSEIVEEAQTDDYVNRIYEHAKFPGQRVSLWINYSVKGLNLRHSPEVCLPSGGWSRVESLNDTVTLDDPAGQKVPISILAYSKDSTIQRIGFWYYIFGEGSIHKAIRGLPITSRSSHGRTTRGSSMTIEIFRPQDEERQELLADFAQSLVKELEPFLPESRESYHRP
jgi:EpsI family protein